MRRIVGRHSALRIYTGRGMPERARRAVANAFMGSFVVVPLAKGIEAKLLRAETPRGGTGRLPLEFAMHALVGAVLLRTGGRDALVHDPELHPPDVQGGQTMDARRGERHAVVRADGVGQSNLAKQFAEERLDIDRLHGR